MRGTGTGDKPRLAVLTPVIGIPSEVWLERQCRLFTRVTPVLMGWDVDPAWQDAGGLEVCRIPGRFGAPRSLARRVMGRLGMAQALDLPEVQRAALCGALAEARVDAVLCHFAWTGMVAEQAMPRDMPLILHVHGRDVSALMSGTAYRAGMRRLLARADALVAVGRHQIDRLAPFGLPARTALIPCGAPLDLFATGPLPRQEEGGRVRFVSVGRISAEKGMIDSLRAFEAMAGEFPQAELVLVGYGPDLDALRAAAEASPFAPRIRLTGRLSPVEIAAELAGAQVYLQHSREVGGWVEGFGVTLTEAGAAGLPLLASATGGLIDQIEEGENGFLFPQGDSAAQAALMRRLAANPALRAEMGKNARRLASRFDAGVMSKALEDVILSVLAARRQAACPT
ncbi:MAG: hypothetical protein DI533_21135 [Cereibacter sphaeroides]|uniref:Glycosyl transferase, group 1 n=1 Tax=Cereibacter sphaeroides TaxID=1063 RepID=A0A2W5RZM1_CERSP|nr:MAG: hypothetical protein DI533_21135 [Cereibacter sphaeroides]